MKRGNSNHKDTKDTKFRMGKQKVILLPLFSPLCVLCVFVVRIPSLSKTARSRDTVDVMDDLIKYPRTRHIEGSGLQRGDSDLKTVAWAELRERFLVVEEKVDGANVGVSFGSGGDLRFQCRGHYLTGGPSEAQFSLLKPWAQSHHAALWNTLGDRYILFGEWLLAKHTVFYDALPHYLLEFDVWDKEDAVFLSTERRRGLLTGLPLVSVPVVKDGAVASLKELTRCIGPSAFKTSVWRDRLRDAAHAAGVSDVENVVAKETDGSDLMEGLYVKWEENGRVLGRYKWVRRDFIAAILDSGSHWRDRPLIKNGLGDGADLFAL